MNRNAAILLLSLLQPYLFNCSDATGPSDPIRYNGYQRGVSFACWEYYCLTGESAEGVLNEIASTGANGVSLTATWYQNTPNSSRIHKDSRKTIADDFLQETIDLAHQIGLKVMLKPHVDVLDGTWRGHIALRES